MENCVLQKSGSMQSCRKSDKSRTLCQGDGVIWVGVLRKAIDSAEREKVVEGRSSVQCEGRML